MGSRKEVMRPEIEKIKKVFLENGDYTAILANYLNNYEKLINKEIMDELTDGDSSLDRVAFYTFLSSAFLNEGEYQSHLEREYFAPSVTKLDPCEYRSDPYYKSIKIPHKKLENWTLGEEKYAPYEGFIWKDLTVDGYREIPNLGFFDEEFSFPAVFENGVEWMAIKPNEIETMRVPIAKAEGDVLVFGLGMGYYAYMVSCKENVSSVTVIERDKSVIELFNEYILPQFPRRDKIKIICADAFDFMKEQSGDGYDFAFVDLWHDISDGVELYIKMRKLEYLMPKARFEYWIEASILSAIRRRVFDAICRSDADTTEAELKKQLSFEYLREFAKFI